VGSIIAMRVGAQDAEIIAKATGAPESELQDLPRGHAWARISADGQPHRALPIRTSWVELSMGHLKSQRRNTMASYARTGRPRPRHSPGGRGSRRREAGLIPLVELTKMQGNATCPQILWINGWENALPTLRPSENYK